MLFGLSALVHVGLFAYAAATTEGFAVGHGLVGDEQVLALGDGLRLDLDRPDRALPPRSIRAPIFALLTGFCAMFGFWLFSLLGRFVERLELPQVRRPLASTRTACSRPSVWTALASAGALAAFAAVFLGGAYLTLRARDL